MKRYKVKLKAEEQVYTFYLSAGCKYDVVFDAAEFPYEIIWI